MKNILAIAMALVIISCNQSVKENKRTKQPKSEIIEIFTSLVKNDVKDDNIDGSFSLAIIHNGLARIFRTNGKVMLPFFGL
jgi:hypothetical protein